ncbi:MAG: LamG domain-containing protein, partial [Phycisphaerales bacterium]
MCLRLVFPISLGVVLIIAANVCAELVGHWKLDEGSGTTTADASGHGNDGTLFDNPTWITGIDGAALEFHGLGISGGGGGYVNCGNNAIMDIGGPISIALWIRPDADDPEGKGTAGGLTAPMAKAMSGMSPSFSWQVRYGWDSAEPYMGFQFNATPRTWVYVGRKLERYEWCHIACSHDGTTVTCYLNGVPTDSAPMDQIAKSDTPVLIGSDGWGCDWIGAIDDVRLYDHALSEAEILSTMEGKTWPYAYGPTPEDGTLYFGTWIQLKWKASPTAVSQDIYIGDNFEDVSAGTGDTFRVSQDQANTSLIVGLGLPGDPFPDGLVPGTTYYWRVDEVDPTNPDSPWKGDVWSFTIAPATAYNPNPSDGVKHQDPTVTLSWTEGMGAKLHYVYFGDNPHAVADATDGTPVPEASFTPAGPLVLDKTYYWRVDEFDGAATYKGDVWSFTTLPDIPITDPNLVGWWKTDVGETDARVIDWSGYGNHGTIVPESTGTIQRVATSFGMGLEFLGDNQGYVELPPEIVTTAKGSILMWINTTQGNDENNDEGMLWWACETSAGNGYGAQNEIHINIDDRGEGELDFFLEEDGGGSDILLNGPLVGGTGWRHVAATWDLVDGCRLYVDGNEVGFAAHNTNVKRFAVMRLGRPVGTGGGNCYYDGLMDDVRLFNHAISAAQINQIIDEGESPLQAGTASPRDGATVDIDNALPLTWTGGANATQHEVYFGLDRNAVADADASDTTGIYRGRQSATSYTPPEGVEWGGGPYFWRVDEINNDGTVTRGRIWSFTVADYLVVDDFESYNDIEEGQPGSNLIYLMWADGFGVPTNGSTMGYAIPFEPTMET